MVESSLAEVPCVGWDSRSTIWLLAWTQSRKNAKSAPYYTVWGNRLKTC